MDESYSFNLISLRKTKEDEADIANMAFNFWKAMWEGFFRQKELSPPNWEEEFYRHDYLALIRYEDRPVGFHLYGLQNLNVNACLGTSYMQSNFNDDFVQNLKNKNYSKAMSLNWLTIDVLFSQKQKDLSLIELMGGLGQKACEELNYDVTIAAIRNDIPLAKKSISLGAVKVGEKSVYETPCDLIYIEKESLSLLPDRSFKMVNKLWNKTKIEKQLAA